MLKLLDQITQPNVSPVRLTDLNKQQVQGQTVTIVGWRSYNINTMLKESTVNILNDDHCERNLRLITQYKQIVHEGILCTAKESHVLLQKVSKFFKIDQAFYVFFFQVKRLLPYLGR